MIAEDVEFQISQYADGTLPAAEKARMDDLLKADPAARQMLDEYRRLDSHLTRLSERPGVRWDRLAEHLSSAINTGVDAGENSRADADEPAIAGRIGWAGSARMRIAAAVLLAVTAGVVVNRSIRQTPTTPTRSINSVVPIAPVAEVSNVTGPSAEVATGESSAEVSVGPSRLAAGDGNSPFADAGLVRGPSRVVISQALNTSKAPKSQPH